MLQEKRMHLSGNLRPTEQAQKMKSGKSNAETAKGGRKSIPRTYIF
jgi:hypothetical protein